METLISKTVDNYSLPPHIIVVVVVVLLLSGSHCWRKLVVDIYDWLCGTSSYCSFLCWSIAGENVVLLYFREDFVVGVNRR